LNRCVYVEKFLFKNGGVILINVIVSVLFTLPVMLLWNALLPDLFNFKEIDFWQALGLVILCSLLFKSNSHSSKK